MSLYQSITTLPLNRFIDCFVDDNLYALVITGEADPYVLRKVWHSILQDYSDKVSNQEYRLYVSVMRELSEMNLEYAQIKDTVTFLRRVYSKYLCDELNKMMRLNLKLDPNDNAAYQEDLNKIMRRTSGLKMKIDLKTLHFDAIKKKYQTGKGKKAGREYFASVLITLSDYAKYRLDDTITVFEYCERIKRVNEYCESIKPQRK